MRERAQQSWPALSKTAYGAAAAAFSRSASAKITLADFPPSSSVTRLIVSRGAAHDPRADLRRAGEADLRDVGMLDEPLPDDRAVPDENVDDAFGDAGFEDQLGEPQHRERRQLGGLDARRCCRTRARGRASRTRCSAESSRGRSARQPQAARGTSCRPRPRPGSSRRGACRPRRRSSGRRRRPSQPRRERRAIGLPTFCDSISASSSRCSSTRVASRRNNRPRSEGETARQAGNALRARATAASVSSTPACSSEAMGNSVAGLITVSVTFSIQSRSDLSAGAERSGDPEASQLACPLVDPVGESATGFRGSSWKRRSTSSRPVERTGRVQADGRAVAAPLPLLGRATRHGATGLRGT